MKHSKTFRLLYLYEKILRGNAIVKKETADYFEVNDKSIQRDIEDLRSFIYEVHPEWGYDALAYDYSSNSYQLTKQPEYFFTEEETLALAKILLDSRAFTQKEMSQILNKLLVHVDSSIIGYLKNAIVNESYHYTPPQHGQDLLRIMWQFNRSIQEQKIVNLTYCRMDGKISEWLVEPQGLIFSEFYFYLIARVHTSNYDNPAIFRLDRIKSFQQIEDQFSVPYDKRFQEGEFRKRIQFMYGGELLKVKFAFWGDSVEAVLDRLPTARVVEQQGSKSIIEAEVYGSGIKMWFLSQGSCLEVLQPQSLRQEMTEIVKNLANEVYG